MANNPLRWLMGRPLWTVVLAYSTLAGCAEPTELVPVEGRITYAGGAWPKTATATFANDQAPVMVALQLDGSFRTQLLPGQYFVNLECWEVEPSLEDSTEAKSYVPDSHIAGKRSGFQVVVPAGAKGPIKVEYDVPKPEPTPPPTPSS